MITPCPGYGQNDGRARFPAALLSAAETTLVQKISCIPQFPVRKTAVKDDFATEITPEDHASNHRTIVTDFRGVDEGRGRRIALQDPGEHPPGDPLFVVCARWSSTRTVNEDPIVDLHWAQEISCDLIPLGKVHDAIRARQYAHRRDNRWAHRRERTGDLSPPRDRSSQGRREKRERYQEILHLPPIAAPDSVAVDVPKAHMIAIIT